MSRDLAQLIAAREPDQRRGLGFGVVIGIVTNNKDDEGLSRVKVRFPWLDDINESFWARVAAPMAGPGRGAYFPPEVDDEVLVAFEHGDMRFPYVIGSLWNGVDKPPVANGKGNSDLRVIKSRSGHVIKLNDERGKETVEIIDASGKNSIVIDTATNSVTIAAEQDITLSAPKGTIRITAQSVEVSSSRTGALTAGSDMTVRADGDLTVKGQTVNIN
jgi:uncharacterized protein involved in type VI secretion and phage assembly